MSDNKITIVLTVIISVILSVSFSSVLISNTQGQTGEQGPPGVQGEQGIQGIQGEQGPRGEQGIQGEKGDPGETYSYAEFLDIVSEELETIKTWTGAADRKTELFYVPTNQIKITWDLDLDKYSGFSIRLYEEGDEYYTDIWSSLDTQPNGETYAYIDPGYYYLDFSVYNCEYSVTVETATS